MSIGLVDLVWKHSQHKGSNLLVLLAIADNADEMTGEAYPSLNYLAAKTRLSSRTVQYVLQILRESGELTVVKRGVRGRATLHRLETQRLRGKAAVTGGLDAMGCTLRTQRVALQPSVEPSVPTTTGPSPDFAQQVFAHWLDATGRNGSTRFTDERRRKVKARLKEYDVDYIKQAVTNCARDPFHAKRGEYADRDGPPYTDLELVCRSDTKLEFFHEMTAAPERTGKGWDDPKWG